MRTCTRPSSGGSSRIVSRCVPSDICPSDTRTGAICAAGEAGLDAGRCVLRVPMAAAGCRRAGRRRGGPASIAIGEEECADGETGAPSAVSRTCRCRRRHDFGSGIRPGLASRRPAAHGWPAFWSWREPPGPARARFGDSIGREPRPDIDRRVGRGNRRGPRRGRRLGEWRRRTSLLHRRAALQLRIGQSAAAGLSDGFDYRGTRGGGLGNTRCGCRDSGGGTVAGCPGSCETAVGGGGSSFAANGGWTVAGSASANVGRPVGAGPVPADPDSLRASISECGGLNASDPDKMVNGGPLRSTWQSGIRQSLHWRHGERPAAAIPAPGRSGSAGLVWFVRQAPVARGWSGPIQRDDGNWRESVVICHGRRCGGRDWMLHRSGFRRRKVAV